MNNEDKINELRKVKNNLLKQVEAKTKVFNKLYKNIDISQPIGYEERELKNEINKMFSEINSIVIEIRTLSTIQK